VPAIQIVMNLLDAQPEVSSLRWVAEARSLTVAFEPAVSFADVAARLPGMVLQPEGTDAAETRLDSVLVASVSILAASAGLGAAAQLAIVLLSNVAAPKGALDIDPVDAIDAAVALLRGDLAGALLSLALILVGAAVWAWLGKQSSLRGRDHLRGRDFSVRAA
jgi:hypothetical protein